MDHVFVMQLDYSGVGYTSVHRTHAGAEAKLHEIADLWGISSLLDPGVTHGISRLPVED